MTTKTTKSGDSEALAKLVEASKTTRLTPEQETEAAGLVKASLLSGKAGIISAVDSMVGLPWIVGVNSIVETWPALKAPSRKNLLAALVAQEGEQARRFRLSLGRGLFVADAEAGLKLIQGVCAEMATGENGMLTQNDRQIFANVLIGKDKPWLLRLPITDEGAETDALVRCAVAATFSKQCPPLTQLFLLRWIAAGGKFAKLPEDLLDLVAKSIKRWHPKLQDQFKADIPEVPPMIEEALKKGPAPQPKPQAQAQPPPENQDRAEGEEPQEQAGQEERPERPERPQSNARQERQDRQERRQQRQQQQQAPQARQPAGGFDLVASLRQIETHVQSLRSELNEAKSELRNRKESPRGHDRDRRQSAAEVINPNSNDVGELQRHNQQLEETITELRQQLEELAADHEDIATSMQAHEETPQADGKEQLKALLGIKLREHFTDFQKLAKEPADEVFREHYRLLLEDVFVILEKQGVVLKEG